jgi:hypothetical protein
VTAVTIAVAATLAVLGLALALGATRDRRRRWRHARPFAGDERAAPEPALVPNTRVYLVYLGWLLVAAGALTAATLL